MNWTYIIIALVIVFAVGFTAGAFVCWIKTYDDWGNWG